MKYSINYNGRGYYCQDIAVHAAHEIEDYYNPEDWTDDIYEIVNNYVDTSLIYYEDQWKVMEAYCTPQEANWGEALGEYISEIVSMLTLEEIEEEEEEEAEDE